MSEHESKTLQIPEERTDEKTSPPPQYKVLIHNDDFTTKVFVIELLVAVFHKSLDAAATLMWHIHHHGYGVAGVYPFEIAETKAKHAMALARANEFPLKLTIEEE
jgi:ATP-dependent Clp protease adaptor protein ClpS